MVRSVNSANPVPSTGTAPPYLGAVQLEETGQHFVYKREAFVDFSNCLTLTAEKLKQAWGTYFFPVKDKNSVGSRNTHLWRKRIWIGFIEPFLPAKYVFAAISTCRPVAQFTCLFGRTFCATNAGLAKPKKNESFCKFVFASLFRMCPGVRKLVCCGLLELSPKTCKTRQPGNNAK